ncbi:hypothetical protein NSMM_340071 [Nitrosomonas mobilis]|uniref:Uncharacterized protein n=1 Tax=Nitrosomonas mobilis TaxID=51642 RepID=A0A1G5SD74_9PROT|nr:hypothetical protein NSMM_340071 [Nitrosomonas mobilis]
MAGTLGWAQLANHWSPGRSRTRKSVSTINADIALFNVAVRTIDQYISDQHLDLVQLSAKVVAAIPIAVATKSIIRVGLHRPFSSSLIPRSSWKISA